MIINPTSYLHHLMRRELTELYWSATIRRLSTVMLAIFAPVYLYNIGYSLREILVWYVVVYLSYALFLFLAAKTINYIGYELSMAVSIPIGIGVFLFYMLLPSWPCLFYILAVSWGLYKSFYWVAYHSDFAYYGSHKNIGKEIGLLAVVLGLVEAITPSISGFLIDGYGISLVFLIASLVMAISATPMLLTKDKIKVENFTIKKFFKKANSKWRQDFWPIFGYGEELVAQAVWPIFIFLTLGTYHSVGLITTLVLLISFVLLLYIGKLTDKREKGRLIKTGSRVVFLAWLSRMFAVNWWAIIFSDSFMHISRKSLGVPLSGIFYNRAKKEEVVYYVAYREFVLSLSKALMALLLAILFSFTVKLYLAFIVAGLFVLLYSLWQRQDLRNI